MSGKYLVGLGLVAEVLCCRFCSLGLILVGGGSLVFVLAALDV